MSAHLSPFISAYRKNYIRNMSCKVYWENGENIKTTIKQWEEY